MQPLWLQRYFTQLAVDTPASPARLEIARQAAGDQLQLLRESVLHLSCRYREVSCSSCGSHDCTLIPGPDYVVEEIEVI